MPVDHPLRPIREIVNTALKAMDETFEAMYADSGRDSIPPEQRLRGLILQALYGLRSERLLCESLCYNMLYRWFVGPEPGEATLGSFDLQQEPRPADRAREGARALAGAGSGAGEGPAQ